MWLCCQQPPCHTAQDVHKGREHAIGIGHQLHQRARLRVRIGLAAGGVSNIGDKDKEGGTHL